MNVLENVSLRPYNTFGIDAKARYFAEAASITELTDLLDFTKDAPMILGGGSNILLTKNVDCLVLRNAIKGIQQLSEDQDDIYVRVGAGESWHGFVQYALGRNWAGAENLSLIPGSVGAAPMQNIGAYGIEIKDIFHELEAFDMEDHRITTFGLNDCEFGYRESIFKRTFKGRFIIVSVTFRLSKSAVFHTEYGAIRDELDRMGVTQLSIQAVSQAVMNIRRSKLPDPAEIGNAGSFFKNPTVSAERFAALKEAHPGVVGYPHPDGSVKLAAGWLIEQCGWKGYRKGDAGCHARQALVLVNYGHATGSEIYELSQDILSSVNARFGVTLEREVNII